jgi:hypothetical protein
MIVVSSNQYKVMKKQVFVALVFLGLCHVAGAQIKLFNGKDLTGWEVHGTEKWFVENGELICESGPDKDYGYLVSQRDFKNFELTVEFKQESNGNSGVFFHCSIDGVKISGWQAEVAPLNMSTGGIYESYGRGWLIKPDPAREKYLKEGEWNEMIVRMEGNQVTTWLNGVQMVTLTDEKIGAATGKIALQIHDGGGVRVKWRKVEIVEL